MVQTLRFKSFSAADARPSAVNRPNPVPPKRHRLLGALWKHRLPLLLILPGILYYLLFYYLPLIGNVVAFENYLPFIGFVHSPFVGFANFTSIFHQPQFWQALTNTLEITGLQLLFFFPAPIILALLLNSLLSNSMRRVIQSILYIPHFMSWVVIVILFQQILGPAGLLPTFLHSHGVQRPVEVMSDPALFKPLVTVESIWQGAGWGTIIFFAALVAIDVGLYEAAAIDGAGAWRRLVHITLPGIKSIVVLLLILNLGNILTVGFEQILLQEPAVGAKAGQVLDTYVYYNGIVDGNWGMAAAVGMIKAVVGLVLVLGANALAHRVGEPGVVDSGRQRG
jgi:putative aldouronate transport system permease protein